MGFVHVFQKCIAGLVLLATPILFGKEDPSSLAWSIRQPNALHDGVVAGIGFSFIYDGKKVGPDVPVDWQFKAQSLSDGSHVMRLTHASGLTATRTARKVGNTDAMEYSVTFRNNGPSPLPPLASVNALDVSIRGDMTRGISVISSGGDAADATYPPHDFAIQRTYFGPMAPISGEVTLSTGEGNSSRTNLPFFFLDNPRLSAGLFFSIGWTGNWKATIQSRASDRSVRAQGGIANLRISLQPGEEISGPTILLGAYRGAFADGANVLRRLIRDQYAPTVDGQRLEPPLLYMTWFDIGPEMDETLFRKLVDRAAELKQEVFLQGTGWYSGTPKASYSDMQATWNAISNSLGNWELGEDRTRFPSGLKAVSDYVRSKGMKFGLSFEPERAGPESYIAKTHPDWILYIPGRRWGMVNFAKPEVQEYFSKIFDRYIRELDIRYLRWDQNNNLLPYWDLEPADRKGITQIRYVEGLHRVEDSIRRSHPGVIFESCAGGGQRIDLDTLRRRHTIWISDSSVDPHINRFHLEGLNHFVPGNELLVGFHPPVVTFQKLGFPWTDITFQSLFGGAFGLAGRLHEWPPELMERTRKHVVAYRQIRKYVSEDFYMLTPQSRTLENWSGWQFHDPKRSEGFVQAFRINSPQASQRLRMKALDPMAEYELRDLYTHKMFAAPGSKLMAEGVMFELGEETSQVLVYRKLP